MKIAFPLSVLAGLVSLTHARLQVATTVLEQEAEMADALGRKKKKQTGWHKPFRVAFKVEHFTSFEDVGPSEFNKKLATGAFNRAFEQVFEGMTMDWSFIDSLVAVPQPDDDPDRRQLKAAHVSGPRPAPSSPYWNPSRRPPPVPVPAPVAPPRRKRRIIYYGNYSVTGDCRLCPEDFLGRGKNGQGESFANFLRDQAKWDEVAKLFCMELKGTGIENFEKVDNCSFTVGYLGESEVELMEYAAADTALESKAATEASGSTNALFTAYRIHPSAVLDVDVLEKAFMVAYNNVFEDRDYMVEGVQLLRQVTAQELARGSDSVRVNGSEVAITVSEEDDGDEDSDENDSDSEYADEDADDDDESDDVDFLTAMYWLKVDWKCSGKTCSADDLLPGVFSQNMPDVSRHTILESYVCHNLREFGGTAFADVAGCDIMFQVGM